MKTSSPNPAQAARRTELIAAGIALLAHEGIEAATMRRLAAAAARTTGTITHYFANRDELLVAMLRHVHAAAGARMLKALTAETNARARLKAVLLEALPLDQERLTEWKVWLAFWGVVAGAPHLASEHANRYEEWQAMLEKLIRENGVQGGKATGLTAHLIAIIDGFGLQLTLAGAPTTKRATTLSHQCLRALEQTLKSEGIKLAF